MTETYVCAAPRCKGRRHRLASLIGRAHLAFTRLVNQYGDVR